MNNSFVCLHSNARITGNNQLIYVVHTSVVMGIRDISQSSCGCLHRFSENIYQHCRTAAGLSLEYWFPYAKHLTNTALNKILMKTLYIILSRYIV